jgi:hypothetical protein
MTVAEERLYLQHVDGFEWEQRAVVRAGLAHVTYDGRVALLAVPVEGNGSALSGVFSDIDQAINAVVALDAEQRWSLYARLQPVVTTVRTTNDLRPGPAVDSEHVAGLTRLLIDVDAPHHDGPPTPDAVALAHDVATLVWAVLLRAGVPRAALSALQSGHGVHLVVACRLGGSRADVQLWRDILASLADALGSRGLGGHLIDRGVADLTHSTRIAGTMNVKYPHDPAPVWLLRPFGGATASLETLQQLARRGRSLREHADVALARRRRQPGAFPPDYRPAWVRELLVHGAAEGTRHAACRRLVGWFVTYQPDDAEAAVDEFVRASRWDASEARAVLRFYQRRTGWAA